jgi:hypothetical protein
VVPDFMRLTLNIAAQVLFTTNLEADAESIRRTLDIGRDYSVDRAWSIFPPPLSIPTRRNREYRSGWPTFTESSTALLPVVAASPRQSLTC